MNKSNQAHDPGAQTTVRLQSPYESRSGRESSEARLRVTIETLDPAAVPAHIREDAAPKSRSRLHNLLFGSIVGPILVIVFTAVATAASAYWWHTSYGAPSTSTQTIASTNDATRVVVSSPAQAPAERASLDTKALPVFEPNIQAQQLQVPVSAQRPFAFAKDARIEQAPTHVSVQTKPAHVKVPTGSSKPLRLRPSAEGVDLYRAPDGLKWQGGWKLTQPQANLTRSSQYSKYVRENFNAETTRSLAVRKVGESNVTKAITPPQRRSLPLLKYGK